MITFVISFEEVAQFVRGPSKRLGPPCFLLSKGMHFGGFPLKDLLLANMSQQRIERNQFKYIGGSERKGIGGRSGCAGISQHELQHTHVSMFLHRTESMICSKNTVTCTNRATVECSFRTLHTHTRVKVKNARSSGWSLVHERINAVPVILLAYRKTETESVGGIKSGLRLQWHVIVFPSNLTCPSCVCTSKVGAWKRKRAARA